MSIAITNSEIIEVIKENIAEAISLNEHNREHERKSMSLMAKQRDFKLLMDAEYGIGKWDTVDPLTFTYTPRNIFQCDDNLSTPNL